MRQDREPVRPFVLRRGGGDETPGAEGVRFERCARKELQHVLLERQQATGRVRQHDVYCARRRRHDAGQERCRWVARPVRERRRRDRAPASRRGASPGRLVRRVAPDGVSRPRCRRNRRRPRQSPRPAPGLRVRSGGRHPAAGRAAASCGSADAPARAGRPALRSCVNGCGTGGVAARAVRGRRRRGRRLRGRWLCGRRLCVDQFDDRRLQGEHLDRGRMGHALGERVLLPGIRPELTHVRPARTRFAPTSSLMLAPFAAVSGAHRVRRNE